MARYIDADKLIEHIKDLPTWWEDEGGVYGHSMKYPEGLFHCEDVINSIENAPTADVVEVKHGHWVAKENVRISKRGRLIHYDRYKCSECGVWNGRHKPKHCPDCGAKMDGKNDNDLE